MEREASRRTGAWGYTPLDSAGRGGYGLGQMADCVTIPEFMRCYLLEKIDLLKMDIEVRGKGDFRAFGGMDGLAGVLVVELHDRIALAVGCV